MPGVVPTPATPSQLLAQLRAQLPAALPTSMSGGGPSATAPDDLFEAYIFGLILEAAKIAGYSIEIRDHNGPASTFHLRRGPGRIYSPGSPTLFTHARLTVGVRPPLEVHSGVAMVGKSKVSHEADVLVLPSSVADRCRSARVDPPSHAAFLAIEAKYWTKPVRLKTGREFLGLRKDSSAKAQVFVCTIADTSATALLAGTPNVEYDDGVLPYRTGEYSLRNYIHRLLRDYRHRQ